MTKAEAEAKLNDHENRLRLLEIGQAKVMVWIGVGTVLVNGVVMILIKLLVK